LGRLSIQRPARRDRPSKNDPKAWGQGWGAYGKRYGASFADNSIGTYMTTAVFPSLLKEDPRYYQMGKGTSVTAPCMP